MFKPARATRASAALHQPWHRPTAASATITAVGMVLGMVSGMVLGMLTATPVLALAAGESWSVVPSPNVGSASAHDYLNGVSCVSPTFCMAVGGYANSSHGYPALFEEWDGRRWSVLPSPALGSPSTDNSVYGISCASAKSCMAVGESGEQALAEHWDGAKWSVLPVPAGEDELTAVDCMAPDACTAVGDQTSQTENSRSLVETWDGTNWSVVPSPNPGPPSQYAFSSGPAHDMMWGVSCPSPKWCAAVGAYVPPSGSLVTLTEEWNGTKWSIVPSPNEASMSNGLSAVSCRSPRFCMAVGNFEAKGYDTLVEEWDGTRWAIVPSPDKGPANLEDDLGGVSCLSPHACVAVGGAAINPGGGSSQTLVESWDGTAWSLVPSPAGGTESGFTGVSCAPSAPCAAVGSYQSGHTGGTLIEMSR